MSAPIIMVVRHGEKPDGNLNGVQLDGTQDVQSLIVQGWQRAGALAVLFDPSRGPLQSGSLAVPASLFAANESAGASERPVQTLQPLASKLNLTINDTFQESDYSDMVNAAIACDGAVLIAWQHDNLPAIGNAIIGNSTTIPQKWPGHRYDMVWVFTAQSGGGYAFAQVPQLLLAGDQATPIS